MDPNQNQSPYPNVPQPPPQPGAGYGNYIQGGYDYRGTAGSGYTGYYGTYGSYGYGGGTDFLSPRRLFKIVRRRWFLILFMTILGIAAATLYFWRAERKYEAAALMEMFVRGERVMDEVTRPDVQGQTAEIFNTRLGRLRGQKFNQLAKERFLLFWDLQGSPTPMEEDPEFAELNYSLIRMSRLVSIEARSSNPKAAAVSANAAADAAKEFFQEENQARSDSAVEWLQNQAEVKKSELTAKEDVLLAFRYENNLDILTAQKSANEQSLLSLNQMLIQTDGEVLRARENLNAMSDINLETQSLVEGIQLPGILPNREAILARIQMIREGYINLETMLDSKTERHPDVVNARKLLNTQRQIVLDEIRSARNTYSQRIDVLENQRNSLMQRIKELSDTVASQERHLLEKTNQLNRYIREKNAAEEAYNGVLARMEQARLAADERTATLEVAEYARVPEPSDYSWPSLIVLLPLGLFGGLGFGLLMAVGLEAVEDRIFSIAELEAEISSRIIGIIPHIAGGKRADLAMISLNQKFGQVAESFNAVRVLLDHINNNRQKQAKREGRSHPGGHVIMFCSGSPSEGKTVSSTNVAITCARAGQKTLLIDCDMRRPRLAKVFEDGIEAKEGDDEYQYSLLHHLAKSGGTDFEKIILPGPTDNLDLMASLASNDINPADLLGGDSIKSLIQWAREHYDRVIIDTPPIGLISDGLVISGLSDGVVAVCRAGQTRHRALRHVLLQFKGVNVSVIGIIVNDFNMKKTTEPLDVHYKEFATGYDKSVYKEQDGVREKEQTVSTE